MFLFKKLEQELQEEFQEETYILVGDTLVKQEEANADANDTKEGNE